MALRFAGVWMLACGPQGPDDGAIEVPVTAPVVFELADSVDASQAVAQWNYLGRNGRMPARMTVDGSRVVVQPAEAVPWGVVQEVRLVGLRDPSGTQLPAEVRTFRTARNPLISEFSTAPSSAGAGRRCEVDEQGQVTGCLEYAAGLGPDGLPGTADDPPVATIDHVYSEGRLAWTDTRTNHNTVTVLERTVYTYGVRDVPRGTTWNLGPDDQFGTDDDGLVVEEELVYGPQAFVTHRLAWTAAGDLARGERWLVSDRGDDLGRLQITGWGPDRTYGTADDCVADGWVGIVDARGQLVREQYTDPGPDCVVLTEDDEVLAERWYTHDDRGARSAFVQVDPAGAITHTWVYAWDRHGHPTRETLYEGHPDLTPGDPLVALWIDTELDAGRRTVERTYYGPGPDLTWFTADDVPSVERRYATP